MKALAHKLTFTANRGNPQVIGEFNSDAEAKDAAEAHSRKHAAGASHYHEVAWAGETQGGEGEESVTLDNGGVYHITTRVR